ncbi:MAG TPA: DUF2878 domain-containing protein [Deltaproteobacteria bacterium]|nr:DUF2878 domain-containing protein [Deltaproteobacteria bacterium]
MTPSHQRPLFTFALSQVGWFACILGAANGLPWLGPLIVALLALHFIQSATDRPRAALRLLAVAVIGLVTDSLLMVSGVLIFPEAVQIMPALPGPPVWMVALWVGFGTTLGGALRALRMRWLGSVLVGAVFGALGYRAGVALGAAELGAPIPWSLGCVALAWGVVLPLMLQLDARLEPSTSTP